MSKVVSFDVSKLPTAAAAPHKYEDSYLSEFVAVMQSGKAAGDGNTYADAKAAKSAANSIKRALRKSAEGISTTTRVWNSGTVEAPAFHFALILNQ